jgi:hypothetical protein
MNTEQFAYWLRGAVESRDFDNITLEEAKALLKSIQDHSALPFKKVTPDLSKKDQDLNELIKRATEKPITPNWPGPAPLPYTPAFGPSDFWLKQHEYKPETLYC